MHHPPASVFQVLGLQACATTPGLNATSPTKGHSHNTTEQEGPARPDSVGLGSGVLIEDCVRPSNKVTARGWA